MIDKNVIKAVLFDMDGVLVNSEHHMRESAKDALRLWNIEAVDSDFTEFIGAGEDKFVGGVAEKHGVKYVTEMKHIAYKLYGERVSEASIAFDGAKQIVRELKARGYKTAVCSSADLVKVEINIAAIGLTNDDFDLVLSGSMVERKKPFPDIFLEAARQLGVDAESCVVIEDAVNGVQAAKSASMQNVAVTTSFTRQELIDKIAPDAIIDKLSELADIL